MRPIRMFVALALAAAALAAAAPPPADGAGGPILPVVASGEDGIESADGMYRYVTLFGSPETTVAKVTKGTGEIDAWTRQAKSKYGGGYGIPQVAADGAVGGLSADGETLVLMRAFGPIDRAGLAVLGTNRLHTKNRIELKGQYSFDAISPDGRTAYVVEYPRPFRYDRYRVLKLNLKSGHLSKEPIVDTDVGLEEEEEKHEGEEGVEGEMRGLALSRVSSADGRWAYTLYDGGGDVPFIHALDTVGDEAVCIFMPQLEDLERKQIAKAMITIGPEAGTLSVVGRENLESTELARVDTMTFAVTTPRDEIDESGAGMTAPLILVGLAIVGLALGGIVLVRRRRGA